MIEYLEFNKRICKQKGRTKFTTPFEFHQFAELFNAILVHEYKYWMATYNAKNERWMVPAHRVKAEHIHTRFVDRKRYNDLITMGIITEHGNVDSIMLKTTMAALYQPHIANLSKTYFYQRRHDEHKEREEYESKSESDFSDEEEFLEDNTHHGRSLSLTVFSILCLLTNPSWFPAAPAVPPLPRFLTPFENRYAPDSPCATCNPALLSHAVAEEDVQMKSVDNSKAVEEFFDFSAAQIN
ncbi:hypothetical protein C0993_009450 [Termitomyces sp. T159_Od127]|nr:hypothetical protein C0993_009450 [Termitomyces sp. T159_Od127]